ncbi:unnamed protein product [Clavelina lepadiformis]|uniref:Uncharacterized protein n=1 Tax=Clavelina lepadiformis TaxID=159417 RepID=A0ABP0G8G6_CLALP
MANKQNVAIANVSPVYDEIMDRKWIKAKRSRKGCMRAIESCMSNCFLVKCLEFFCTSWGGNDADLATDAFGSYLPEAAANHVTAKDVKKFTGLNRGIPRVVALISRKGLDLG